MSRGRPRLSLVEAALLLCIAAIVLAVFVPAFIHRVRTNKISEAAELLQEMHDRAAAYYETSWGAKKRFCLPPGAGPTPASPSVDLVDVEFAAEEQTGHASWAALGFQPERPLRYSYSYRPSHHGCDLPTEGERRTVSFRAEGDLDGDAVLSTFERRAEIEADGLQPVGALHVHQRVE
ncbi:MAG: pilus assembly FimT family protein [Polyangiales bacterium]